MKVHFHERTSREHQFSGHNDNRGGSVSDLFVLDSGELNHALGGRVLDVDLTKDGVAVVGHDDSAHGVEQHFEHGLGTEG